MKCSVSACKNLSNYKRGKSCFRFLKDVILLKKWLEAIRQPEFIPNSRNFICENHFVEADIQRLGKRKNLKNDAVPSRLIDMIDVQMCDQPGLIMEESESLLTSNMEEVSIEVASNTHGNFVYGAWPISASYSTVNTGDVIALIPSNASQDLLEKHYADLSARPFFPGLVKYMASGPVVPMVWEGLNVVKTGRVILGATDPADSAPGTIRGDYCIQVGRNICHGSDAVESAKKEIGLWFTEKEVVSWTPAAENWVYE